MKKNTSCPTLRRKLVTTKFIIFGTGEEARPSTSSWLDEACGTPLFMSDGDVCRSCERGWWSPRNYPVEMAPALDQPCPSVPLRPEEVHAEYDNLYIAHFAGRKAVA